MMMSFKALGIDGWTSMGGFGVSFTCASITEKLLVALNMRCPVTISYMDTPTEYKSERASVISDFTCSGDM
jgi:hypothetical protein